jgi:pimeloyl-ACP methyl ester carboxylesterase
VVFIHGYTGARETWTNGQAYWPALLASDSDLKDRLDIYSVVYDSLLFSGPPIREVVADLEKELDALMVQKRYAKVIFICHSLGGIVAGGISHQQPLRRTALGRFRLVSPSAHRCRGARFPGLRVGQVVTSSCAY